ncbi:hypothetical protein H5410_027291, partial [Solanum commersonii]
TNKTHQQSPTTSSNNSVNSQINEAINVAFSERELDGSRKNISSGRNEVIHEMLFSGNDSPNQELQYTTKSSDIIVPIVRSEEANSGQIAEQSRDRRLHIRASSQQIRGDLNTGDYSLDDELPLTATSSKMDARITGDHDSGGGEMTNKEINGDVLKGSFSAGNPSHLTNISVNLTQEHVQEEIQATLEGIQQLQADHHQPKIAESRSGHGTNQRGIKSHNLKESNSQKTSRQVFEGRDIEVQSNEQDQRAGQAQNDHLVSAGKKTIEVIDVEGSSQFSFGVKIADTNPDNEKQQRSSKEVNSNYVRNTNLVQVQLTSHTKSQDTDPNKERTQSGKSPDPNLVFNAVNPSVSAGHVHINAKGQQAGSVTEQEQVMGTRPHHQVDQQQGKGTDNLVQNQPYKRGESSEPSNYHNAFPKISNNFEKHVPQNQNSQHINNPNQANDQTTPNNIQHTKKDQISGPAPYTVVQTMAARLRHNQALQETPIELVLPKITSKQGLPAVIYDMDDFMTKLASFITQTQLTEGANIAHYNAKHVFIDLDNELDYNTVWTQQRMTIEGKLMRIQTWTPNFRPEEETPIVPIWILLPGLPWHCFKKEFITPLLSPIGKVLYLNTASIKRTRASMAKVKVQIDLTKDRPRHVWIGLDEEDLTIGRWQTIEYESIPPYCAYCKHQGHMIFECNLKIRDEEFKKRKELEIEKKDKNKEEQMPKGNDNQQTKAQENDEEHNQSNKEVGHQRQAVQHKEEEWKTQRRRNNKQQGEKVQKAVWRPTSPQNKRTSQQAGITNNPNHNSFTNLNMREVQHTRNGGAYRNGRTQTQGASGT